MGALDVDDAAEATGPVAASGLSEPRSLLALLMRRRARPNNLIGLVLVVGAAGVIISSTSFFFSDDFLFGSFFVENDLTWELLFRSYFGHLVPASALFQWLFYNSVGLNWAVATVIMVAFLVGGAIAVTRLIDAVAGARWLAVVAGGGFALSAGVLTLVSWWGASLGNLVPLVSGISFLGALSRWDKRGRARHLVYAVLVYTFAALFYEKSLLFSVYAALWTVLVLDAGLPLRERARRLLRRWPLWIGIGLVSAAICVVYLSGAYRDEAGATPAIGLIIGFILRGVFLGLIPAVFGLDLQQTVWSGTVVPLAVLANLLAFAFVVWTVVRAPRTVGVWVCVGLVILLGEVPLAVGRAGLVGIDGGRLLRYQIEGAFFLVVGAAIALHHVHAAQVVRRHAQEKRSLGAKVVAIAGALALCAVAWGVSVLTFVEANPGTASRQWFDEFSASWPRDTTVRMVDGPVPANVVFDWSYPYSMTSRALPQLVDNVEFTTGTEDAWAMGPDGEVGPFAFDADVTQTVDQCSVDGQPVLVPVEDPSTAPRQLLVSYRADAAGQVFIAAGVGAALGDTSGLSPRFDAAPGEGSLVMTVRPGAAIDTVSVTSAAPGFCVESVSVGVATGDG